MKFIGELILLIIMTPGALFAAMLGMFKKMGDGTGNESGMIAFRRWSAIFAIIFWTFAIGGVIYALKYPSTILYHKTTDNFFDRP